MAKRKRKNTGSHKTGSQKTESHKAGSHKTKQSHAAKVPAQTPAAQTPPAEKPPAHGAVVETETVAAATLESETAGLPAPAPAAATVTEPAAEAAPPFVTSAEPDTAAALAAAEVSLAEVAAPAPVEASPLPMPRADAPAAEHSRPAGPFRRLFAFLYDAVFLALLLLIAVGIRVGFTLEAFMRPLGTERPLLLPQLRASFLLVIGGWAAFAWLYLTASEALPIGGTIGKRLFNVQVRGDDGKRISFLRSNLRLAASIIALATVAIGFVVAFFRRDRRMLQDLLTRTYVVRSE